MFHRNVLTYVLLTIPFSHIRITVYDSHEYIIEKSINVKYVLYHLFDITILLDFVCIFASRILPILLRS